MGPAKDALRRLSSKFGRDYLERTLLKKDAPSAQSRDLLLTGQPAEGGPAHDGLPFYVPRFSTSTLDEGVFADTTPSGGTVTLVVRNPTERTSGDSQFMLPPYESPATESAATESSATESPVAEPQHREHDDNLGPDAITAAPPRRTHSRSDFSEATTANTNQRLDSGKPRYCFMCGNALATKQSPNGEKLAYLPCGHAFGHDCLFTWISRPESLGKCPDFPCIPMRHFCEHWTLPKETPPAEPFKDADAGVLPWNYEFCSTPKALKILKVINTSGDKVRRLDAQKRDRKKSNFDLAMQSRLKYHSTIVEQAERRLDEAQKIWWTNCWKEFGDGEKKKSRGWLWQRARRSNANTD
ncbi:uncharacterized protein UV8b_06910 [Ustilaginoidea virens]|uniref:RING-type domain-containing protein n=1 Tax=Ustilaginoidea virens TaxID=1159556 RepID=A0A8E5HW23_USTVR|nr:uncharacterized protein UV8b_06910 [Ustilaginoidea virens]QUC22669.1 hypothetical protein UV8b_06910 [Ustilaginoidea virens]